MPQAGLYQTATMTAEDHRIQLMVYIICKLRNLICEFGHQLLCKQPSITDNMIDRDAHSNAEYLAFCM